MKKVLLAIGLLLLPRLLAAQPLITAIEVTGNQGVETQAILATIRSRVAAPLSLETVRYDILSLYRMGVFEDIRVEKAAAPGGIRLFFRVVEKAQITKISFEGNKKVKEVKLTELIDLKPFRSMDAEAVQTAVAKIRAHYESEGYHLVEIRTEYRPDPKNNGRELVFEIQENEPVRVKRVRFLGNKAFSDRELRKLLKSREKSRWSWATGSGKYQEELIRRDVAFLTYHYQNHGYLKVRVTAPQVSLSRDRRWITLTFRITEGSPYRVRSVDIAGDILTTREELLALLETRPGQLYSREKLEKDLLKFSELYGDQGYAFASIQPAIRPDDEAKGVDITFVAERGRKITIEKVNISGNTITRDKVIRRELIVKEGSLYSETGLRESRRRLDALGFFEEINFATPRGSSDEEVHLNISVKEKPTGTFTIGAGFSSAENFIFNAAISKNNFFGYGISGQIATELSSKRQLFILSAEDPYFLDTPWILGVSGFRAVNVFSDFDRRSFGGSLTLGRRLFDFSTLRFMYQIESVDVGDFRTAVPAVFSTSLSGLSSSLTTSLQRDTRNNRIFPTKGMLQNFSTEYSGLGGDVNFIRLTENFRYYQPIVKSIVAKFNLTVGNAASLESTPVPLFERFFMGGINSLRGYTLRSVGPFVRVPSSPSGGDERFVIGGNKMMQMNFELEFPLYEPAGFKTVAFFDTGQAFSEPEAISFREFRSNYGFGLRWNSPMGPLRFEWGIPIKRQTGEDTVVFNFAIGSFF